MAIFDLHNQDIKNLIADLERIAFGMPGQEGAYNIQYKEFIKQVQSNPKLYNSLRALYGQMSAEGLTANRTYQLPDKDGVLALLSDVVGMTPHPDPSIALSDETSDLVPLENDASITLTRAQTFTAFSASVTTAPTDANLNVDVLLNGSVIATITIVAGQTYGTTTTISNVNGAVADVLKFDLTQVGATIAGTGLKGYTLSNLV